MPKLTITYVPVEPDSVAEAEREIQFLVTLHGQIGPLGDGPMSVSGEEGGEPQVRMVGGSNITEDQAIALWKQAWVLYHHRPLPKTHD